MPDASLPPFRKMSELHIRSGSRPLSAPTLGAGAAHARARRDLGTGGAARTGSRKGCRKNFGGFVLPAELYYLYI